MYTFAISIFEILSTGNDGGHKYLRTEIIHNGHPRKLIVFFENKKEEDRLIQNEKIIVEGELQDDGIQQSLLLNNARIISK